MTLQVDIYLHQGHVVGANRLGYFMKLIDLDGLLESRTEEMKQTQAKKNSNIFCSRVHKLHYKDTSLTVFGKFHY